MTGARATILANLNLAESIERLDHPGEAIKPDLKLGKEDLIKRLQLKLQSVHASVDIIDTIELASESLIRFLKLKNAELRVGVHASVDFKTLGSDIRFPKSKNAEPGVGVHASVNVKTLGLDKPLTWYQYTDLSICQTVLSFAPIAIAESGSLVMPSEPERPTLANFLPDNSIIVVNASNIVSHLEDALLLVKNGDLGLPRALNLISGPSKTADIEQTLVYGAHGPIELHVIIVRDE